MSGNSITLDQTWLIEMMILGEKGPMMKIRFEENVIGEKVALIVEERVIDSSFAEMSGASGVLEPSVVPSVDDTMGKTGETLLCLINLLEMMGLDANIPSVVDIESVIVKAVGERVITSVSDTDAKTAGSMERPMVGKVYDTLDVEEDADVNEEQEAPLVAQPTVDGEWLLEHDAHDNNAEE
ncbi:hypothetical protein LIER_38066 [Lithospermum erythrorhizon]|uniref:Uncharacterized protein n=1 Tax=Lithospermum erythrorhizon TaxID=34254 RepID=A0AAV3PWN2_LITER